MSRNYDNWEKLVAAVIKREKIREICHANSINTSLSSDFDSQFQQDFESAVDQELSPVRQTHEVEWIELYQPGVYITLGHSRDGNKTEIRPVQFSRRRFNEIAAETWWYNNRDKVYLRFFDTSDHVELVMLETPVLLGTNMKPKDSLVDTIANIQTVTEWVENYEADVCVTLRANRDGTRDVVRVRFSGRKFEARQAEAWWLMHREKVHEKYGARGAKIRGGKRAVYHSLSAAPPPARFHHRGRLNNNSKEAIKGKMEMIARALVAIVVVALAATLLSSVSAASAESFAPMPPLQATIK